jgi:hypothetical protein
MNINLGDHQDLTTPSNTNLIIGLVLSFLITAATFFVCTSFVEMLKSEMAEVQKILDDVF